MQKQDVGPPGAEGMVYDSSRKRTILLVNRTTWEWDGENWVELDDMGPAGSVALAYDTSRSRVISFGTKDKQAGETWAWDGEGWIQVADTGPGPRATAMAYDIVRDRIVLFGGEALVPPGPNPPAIYGDTWEWNGEGWTQEQDQGPTSRVGHALVYDAERKQTILFGGIASSQGFGDTWAWDGQRWKLLTDFGPSARYRHAMVFDDHGKQTILFGGSYLVTGPRPVLVDTWSWDGKSWIQRQDMGPPARYGAVIVYDSDRDRTVLFGGGGAPDAQGHHPTLHDTWELTVS
jgi:hypothetical protein